MDRQKERLTYRQKWTDEQMKSHTDGWTDVWNDKWMNRQMEGWMNVCQIDSQIHGLTVIQEKHIEKQSD